MWTSKRSSMWDTSLLISTNMARGTTFTHQVPQGNTWKEPQASRPGSSHRALSLITCHPPRKLHGASLISVTFLHSHPWSLLLRPGGINSLAKNLPANARDTGLIPGSGRSPGEGKIPWSRKRQPSPVFLPGKSHGQRSLAGYHP